MKHSAAPVDIAPVDIPEGGKKPHSAFPTFAPLPSTLVYRFIEERDKYDFPLPGANTLSEQSVYVTPYFQPEQALLEQCAQEISSGETLTKAECFGLIVSLLRQVQKKRAVTYTQMDPFAGTLSTEWLLETLRDMKHAVTPTTLSRWRDGHLLRSDKKDRPDSNSAAAVLIAAQLHKQHRGFLPKRLAKGEPAWWCWRQDSPSDPVIPCPVPLPDLPPSALLWTQWTGAAWHPEWLNVGQKGAIRWGGTDEINGKLLWNVPSETLAAWMPGIISYGAELDVSLKEMDETPEIRHTLANIVLLHLARTCLRVMPLQRTKEVL